MEDLNITRIVNDEIQPLEKLQESFQQKAIVKTQNEPTLYDRMQTSYTGGAGIVEDQIKPSIEYQVPIEEGYKLVGDEWISKYPTYEVGRDNAEYAAQNQSTFDKWSNGMLKAGANLGTTVAGNTVGLIIGAAEGVSQGSWNAVFDSNFSNMLADYNDKLNYQLPNYVSKDEMDDNFFESMGTANFWAKDVLGGLSFTLGTVASEAIWGLATGGIMNSAKWGLKGAQIAKWGKAAVGAEEAALGLANYKQFVAGGLSKLFKPGSLATTFSKTAKIANTARFLATTSGNEAGIEALHYKREQKENFYDNFERLNGREPSKEEIEAFENNLENSANAVFATNMAILMPSNLAMFGSIFNINSPVQGISKSLNRSLFGIGVEKSVNEVGEVLYKGLQATSKQKVLQYGYAALKPLVTEGLWEEGLQGVTTKTAENWISATYDPKYNNKTIDLIDASYKAFADQYGTKEGWKEIGIGAIIGLGSSMVIGGGKFEEVREFEKEEKYQEDYVAQGLNQFGDQSTLATDNIVRKMMFNARVANATERQKSAVDAGNGVEAALAQQDLLIAEMQFRKAMGEDTKDLVKKYETALEIVPIEEFEKLGITDVAGYKSEVLDGYKNLATSYERASNFADAVLGDTKILGQDVQTQQLKDALTHSIVSGEKANVVMEGLLKDISSIIGQDSAKAMQIQTEFQRLGKNKQEQVRKVNKIITDTETQIKTLSSELLKLQASKDEEKGARLQVTQQKLLEANERLVSKKQEREELAKEAQQERTRRRGVGKNSVSGSDIDVDNITGSDLADIDLKLNKIEETIKSYDGVNHEVYYDLLNLKQQYLNAKKNYFGFQNSIDSILGGKFAPKSSRVNGLLSRIFEKNETVSNFTNDFLTEMYDNFKTTVAEATVESLSEDIISDEDFNSFESTGEVSEEVMTKLASRVKSKEILTDREDSIFKAKVSEVNSIINRDKNKPNLSPEVVLQREVQSLEKEKAELEKILDSEPTDEDKTTSESVEAKRLLEINKRLNEIKKQGKTLTEAEAIREQIEESFSKDYPMLTQDVDEMIKGKPTESEIKRYEDLYKRRANLDLAEQSEFEALQPRMSKWYMAQSLPSGESTIADLVEVLSQLETTSNRNETLTEVNAEEISSDTPTSKDAHSTERQDILQNVVGSVVVKVINGEVFFMHLKAENVIGSLLPNVSIATVRVVNSKGKLNKEVDLTDAILKENAKKEGTVFKIGNTTITIGKRGSIVIPSEDYNRVKDILNLHYFDAKAGKWSYADVYEKLEDGTYRKKDSELDSNIVSDNIYNVEEGDVLDLFVDMKTQWNQDLIYDALEEINDNGKISDELKKKIVDTLEITSRKGSDNNGMMKASYDSVTEDNFLFIRKRYADTFIDTLEKEQALVGLPRTISLGAEVNMKDIYLGTPNYQLDSNLKPMDLPITERGAQEIITQGFVSKDGMELGDKNVDTEKVSNLYVTNLLKSNPELKIPVVVLRQGSHMFAFPITVNKTVEDKSAMLDKILEESDSPMTTVKAVNMLMISLGISTRMSKIDLDKLAEIRTQLESYTLYRTAEELASSEYKSENLVNDATIKVDLENKVISSPKISIDYSTLTIGTLTEVETDASNLRASIVKNLKEIETAINSTPELSDKSKFLQAFDNNAVENQGSDIMNRKDINFIKPVFFNELGNMKTLKGEAVEAAGKERLLKMRKELQRLEFYENQIKVIKNREAEKNLNC